MREWLVIESSMKNAVFAPRSVSSQKGYIPRDAAEQLLGRDLSGNQWFTREESEAMRSHLEWRDTEPAKHEEEPAPPTEETTLDTVLRQQVYGAKFTPKQKPSTDKERRIDNVR